MTAKPDIERLDRVMALIEEEVRKIPRGKGSPPSNPEEIRQSCGTAFCAAGWTVVDAGAKIYWKKSYDFGWVADDCRLPHYSRETIRVAARRLLGLQEWEADKLFESGNTLRDLRRIVREIKKRAAENA